MSNTATKEAKSNPECPSCGAVLTRILASCRYTIEHSEEQCSWVKDEGSTTYVCGNCMEELNTHDIEDILRQVDEL